MTEFNVGDLVRFKGHDSSFVLEDVNPNENYKELDEYYALGSNNGGFNNVDVAHSDDIELVMPASEASKRRAPTPVELEAWLSGVVHRGMDDSISVYSSEQQNDGSVLVEAETSDGLDISFLVRIESVYEN